MVETPNPYQSPVADNYETWWSKLRRWLIGPITGPPFERGGKIITEGIIFYLDLEDSARLYAASPSTDQSDARLNLVVSEAIRIFPRFLCEHPHLQPSIQGRNLTIRIINEYASKPAEFIREYQLDWDYVAGVLKEIQAGE